ncbi:MAG: hypothetical protein AABY22_23815 [Nanoarchaeota archaeon]
MKNLRKERKVLVEKIDHFEVRYVNDSSVYTVNTEPEAKALAKRMEEEEEKKKVVESNDKELRNIEANKIIRRELEKELQNLVTMQRGTTSERADSAKQLRVRLKKIIESAERRVNTNFSGAE